MHFSPGFARTRDARRWKIRWLLLPVVCAAPLIGVVGGQHVDSASGLSGNGARPVNDSGFSEDYFDGLIRDLQNAISREDELLREDLEFSLLQKEEDRRDAEAVSQREMKANVLPSEDVFVVRMILSRTVCYLVPGTQLQYQAKT